MNDEAAKTKQGSILSSYAFTEGSSCFVETDFTTGTTTVYMSSEV